MIVGIEQVITRTKFRLRLSNGENDSYLEKLIDEGARHLGSMNAYKVSCAELDIECTRAQLPPFFEEFIAGRFPSGGGCSCGCTGVTITNGQPEPTSLNVLNNNGCSCPVWYVNPNVMTNWSGSGGRRGNFGQYFDIDIANQVIQFPSTITATQVKIWYKSANVDDNGLMVINEFWERGLSAYAAMQFGTDYPERYLPEQRARWSAEWVAQRNKIVSKEVKDRFRLDKGAIQNIMNAIVINKFVVGAYNTQGYI